MAAKGGKHSSKEGRKRERLAKKSALIGGLWAQGRCVGIFANASGAVDPTPGVGDEERDRHTPLPKTLRTLLIVACTEGHSVAVGNCRDAFLPAPIMEDGEIWVWPPAEAEEECDVKVAMMRHLDDFLQIGPRHELEKSSRK